MSDGPHRSLPMRRRWKKVAECGANNAFDPEQVSELIAPALEDDCRAELPDGFVDEFVGLYGSLFRDHIEPELERLRERAGLGLGAKIIEFAILHAATGETGLDAPTKAVTDAFMDRAQRCSRQIEELWLRESSARKSQEVRSRIDEGISNAAQSIQDLARRVLKIDSGSSSRPQKHDGLDDGVRLPND